MKTLLMYSAFMLSLCLFSCEKEKDPSGLDSQLVGEWNHNYQLLDDGTKNFDNPYALVGFTYSDGFILNADGSGNTIWYDQINGDLEWERRGNILVLIRTNPDKSKTEFDFKILDLGSSTMWIRTFEDSTYSMQKK